MELHHLNKGLILTTHREEQITFNHKVVRIAPVWKWLLEMKNEK